MKGVVYSSILTSKKGERELIWRYFMWLKEKNRGKWGSLLRCYVQWNNKFSKFNGIFFINREINRRLNPRRNDVIFVRHRMSQYFQDTSVINNKKNKLDWTWRKRQCVSIWFLFRFACVLRFSYKVAFNF